MRPKEVFELKKSSGVRETPSDNKGTPVRIITISKEGKFELDVEALARILLQDSIRNKLVAVVSIVGDYRKGKSFLLNLFLRYLQSGCQENWLDDVETPLKGFSWKGGCDRDTTGILMWSQPFIIKGKDGRDVAILLMDTQGIFGTDDTLQDSAKIFAMSTLISSVQIYNQTHNLQENDLQVIDVFAKYGEMALDAFKDTQKPFQKLMFLIRDWSFLVSYKLGLEGGKAFLENKLAIEPDQKSELQRLRKRIESSFEYMDCYLMPDPGNEVKVDENFDGKIADIDIKFIQHLKPFASLIFDPSYLAVKEISGQPITAMELYDYIQVYIKAFENESLPEPMTLYDAMAEVTHLKTVYSVLNIYVNEMKLFCGSEKHIKPKVLQSKHIELKDKAIKLFNNIGKIGDPVVNEAHRDRLIQKIDEEYKYIRDNNLKKKKSLKAILFGVGSGAVLVAGAMAMAAIQMAN